MKTILFFLSLPLAAQTSAPPVIPQGLLAAGASYNVKASPRVGGWVSLANLVAKSGGGTYAYSTMDLLERKGKPMTSIRTGAAQLLHAYGPISVLALVQAGIATSASATTGAFSGGGVFVYRPKRTDWAVIGEIRAVTAGGVTQPVFEIGFGRTF